MLKKFFSTTVLALALSGTSSLSFAADKYDIDPTHATFLFKINHLGFSNTYGWFKNFSGSFTIDEKDASKSSVNLEIDVASVDTNAPKRDDHLRGPDFFNVKQNPKITFASKSVKMTKANTYEVSGDFKMNGVTKPISFTFNRLKTGEDPWKKIRTGGEMNLKIKRSDYGIKYGLPGIGDDVEIIVSLEGVKAN